MIMKVVLLVLLWLCTAVSGIWRDDPPMLKGIALKRKPYIWQENGVYVGFLIDLFDAIASRSNFNYTLNEVQFTTTSIYGEAVKMVAEKQFDFVLSDVEIRPHLQPIIDYSMPLFEDQFLAALISRTTAQEKNLHSVEDLVSPTGQLRDNPVPIWTTGYNYAIELNETGHPVARQLVKAINNDGMVNLEHDYVNIWKLIKNEGAAFLFYQQVAQYHASHQCDLVVLRDLNRLIPRTIALPFQKNSPYLEQINIALYGLQVDGIFRALEQKYWRHECPTWRRWS